MPQNDKLFRQRQREANLAAGIDSDQSVDERLNAADEFLGQDTVADRAGRYSDMRAGEDREMARLKQESRVAPVLGRAAKGAMLPAAFLGGPVGMAAGGALALEGLQSAMSPGASGFDQVLGAAGAIPFVGPAMRGLRGLRGASKAAGYLGKADDVVQGADMATDALTRVRGGAGNAVAGAPGEADESIRALSNLVEPYAPNVSSYGDEAVEAAAPAMRNTENEVLEGVTSAPLANLDRQHADFLSRMMNASDGPSIQVLDDVDDMTNASGESAASLEALSRAAGMKSRGEQFAVQKGGVTRPLIGPDAVDYTPQAGEVYGILREGGGFNPLTYGGRDTTARFLRQMRSEVPAPTRTGENARFGMGRQRLPELSENELARIKSNIDRVTSKR